VRSGLRVERNEACSSTLKNFRLWRAHCSLPADGRRKGFQASGMAASILRPAACRSGILRERIEERSRSGKQRSRSKGMLRIGWYSANDKWEILCRHWASPGSVPDPGVDRFNRPLLPEWHAVASRGGQSACAEYLRLKLDSLQLAFAAEGPAGAINREIAQLAERLGHGGLQERARNLGQKIPTEGFLAPFDVSLSVRLVERLRDVFKAGALRQLRWTDDRGEIPSIEVLRTHKGPFPTHAISGKRKVLSLFGAMYYGRNDVIHIHDIYPDEVTLVDANAEAMNGMQLIYPAEWSYAVVDFQEFLDQAPQRGLSYDLIVCDPFRGLGVAVAWDLLPTIMGLCTDTYITNYFVEMFGELGVAKDDLDGLSRAVKARTGVDVAITEVMERSSDVSWVVMRKR
jgi:hypothetical protein